MNQNFFILVLCLLLLAGTALSNTYREEPSYIGDWQKEPVRWPSRPDTIDIDDDQGDSYDVNSYDGGSADDYYSGSPFIDDDGGDDDDNDAEGSGMHTGTCLTVKKQLLAESPIGYYIPECTETGEWKPRQCHYTRRECWCVDDEGNRIPGTKQKYAAQLVCREDDSSRTGGEISVVTRPKNQGTPPSPRGRDDNDDDGGVGFDEDADDGSKFPGYNDNDNQHGEAGKNSGDDFREEQPKRVSLIMQPGILAGIIGGAVVGLLCTVLLMMFIVYRMRKKDEGSYALDDPKQKARDREFFA